MDDVSTPTAAIGIMAAIPIFEYGTYQSERDLLKSMFRTIHRIRPDDVLLNDDEARAAKRVPQSVATARGSQF